VAEIADLKATAEAENEERKVSILANLHFRKKLSGSPLVYNY
jgi:hypothetical protein